VSNFENLGIGVETSQVKEGAADLDKLAESADKAEAAAERLKPAFNEAGAQVQATGKATQQSNVSVQQHANNLQMAGLSAKQYAQAMRGLPAQITDIVTGLVSGQPAYMVAIQQGGQLKDMFGGLGNAIKAVSTVITPVRLLIAALGLTVGVAANAYNQGQKEGFEYARAIQATGNYAGITKNKIAELSSEISDFVGTQHEAAATLAQLAGTGVIAGNDLKQFAIVAQDLKRTAGVPIEDTVKAFVELGRSPVEASLKLNQTMHYLTASTYQQIAALEQQGRTSEAAEAAQRAYAEAWQKRSDNLKQSLGFIQRATTATGDAFKSMWSYALNIGREDTVADRIRDLEKLAVAAKARGGGRSEANVQEQITALKQQQKAAEDLAAAQRKQQQAEEDGIKKAQEAVELNKIRIQEANELGEFKFDANTDALKRALNATLGGFEIYSDQLELLKRADLVSDKEYFAKKTSLIKQETAAQIDELNKQKDLIAKEIQRLQGQRINAGENAFNTSGGSAVALARAEEPFDQKILQLREEIKKVDSEILEVRQRQGAQLGQQTTQEAIAAYQRQRALDEAQRSAQAYLATLDRAYERQLGAIGKGDRQREIEAAKSGIDEKFANQRLDLSRDLRRNQITQEQYDEQLKIIDASNQSALQKTQDYYDKQAKLQEDFGTGAKEALANYLDSARDVAAQSEQVFTNVFQGLEDLVADFVTTGKASFGDFARSVVADLVKIQLKAAFLQIAGKFDWTSIFATAAKATVGSSASSTPNGTGIGGGLPSYDVGTSFVPKDQIAMIHKGERIIPASMNRQGGWQGGNNSPVVNQTNYFGAGVSIAQMHAFGQQLRQQTIAEVAANLSRGRWTGVSQ
jgi:lambda family phage tail tape measure protein